MLQIEPNDEIDPTAHEYTVVSTSFPPTEDRVVTEFLYEHVAPEDTVVLVTADSSLPEVIRTYEDLFAGPDTPTLSLINAAVDYRFTDTYHDIAVFGVPGVEDLTNITIGITDLASDAADGSGAVHVVAPDLGPFLANDLDLVQRTIESITELDAVEGTVVGVEYTKHETETVTALHERADAVLWGDKRTDGTIRFTADR